MKKAGITILIVGMAAAASATIIASDDFSGGTVGDALNGVSVQTGIGTWTTANKLTKLEFASGGVVSVPQGSSSGNAVLENDYSSFTDILKVSVDFTAGNQKTGTTVSLGLYETINKSYLQNIGAANTLGIRFITSGANEGNFQWRIYGDSSSDTTYDGSLISFAAADVLRMSLSYNFDDGEIVADIYNLTQSSSITTVTNTFAGLSGFNYAGIGLLGVDTSATENLAAFDNFQVESIPEPATLGLCGIVAAGMFVVRRFRM
jgi:hypothetical protein